MINNADIKSYFFEEFNGFAKENKTANGCNDQDERHHFLFVYSYVPLIIMFALLNAKGIPDEIGSPIPIEYQAERKLRENECKKKPIKMISLLSKWKDIYDDREGQPMFRVYKIIKRNDILLFFGKELQCQSPTAWRLRPCYPEYN